MRTVAQLLARDSGLTLDPNTLANKIETFVNDAFDMEFQLANVSEHMFSYTIYIPHKSVSAYTSLLSVVRMNY